MKHYLSNALICLKEAMKYTINEVREAYGKTLYNPGELESIYSEVVEVLLNTKIYKSPDADFLSIDINNNIDGITDILGNIHLHPSISMSGIKFHIYQFIKEEVFFLSLSKIYIYNLFYHFNI